MDRLFYALLHAAALAMPGYQEPATLPHMEPVTSQTLRAIGCGHSNDPYCLTPQSVYLAKVVYYDKSLNLEYEYPRSIMLHELVHYIQDMNGYRAMKCTDRGYLEDQAYEIQYAYLVQFGVDMPEVRKGANSVFCPYQR